MENFLKANTHIHTPHSFSAFDSVEHAVKLAREQKIAALGISDFNTCEGYDEFAKLCGLANVYPLYGMEMITMLREDKENSKRWNDANPGIIYYCAKALDYPPSFSQDSNRKLHSLWEATQQRIIEMISKLNDYMLEKNVPISLDYETIRSIYANNTVRERHLARAVYHEIMKKENSNAFFCKIFNDDRFAQDAGEEIGIQNQIRSKLLKAGKPCYVEEDDSGFMKPSEARELVLDGGGIPCYPVLVNDKAGLTEYENDPSRLADLIKNMGIHLVEFIPSRNSFDILKKYVLTFVKKGFTVVFGTEHNTPALIPMEPMARGQKPFDSELARISYEGACVLAAHQEMKKIGGHGYVDTIGNPIVKPHKMGEFISLGDKAIRACYEKR